MNKTYNLAIVLLCSFATALHANDVTMPVEWQFLAANNRIGMGTVVLNGNHAATPVTADTPNCTATRCVVYTDRTKEFSVEIMYYNTEKRTGNMITQPATQEEIYEAMAYQKKQIKKVMKRHPKLVDNVWWIEDGDVCRQATDYEVMLIIKARSLIYAVKKTFVQEKQEND
jgi:hypothetical protein